MAFSRGTCHDTTVSLRRARTTQWRDRAVLPGQVRDAGRFEALAELPDQDGCGDVAGQRAVPDRSRRVEPRRSTVRPPRPAGSASRPGARSVPSPSSTPSSAACGPGAMYWPQWFVAKQYVTSREAGTSNRRLRRWRLNSLPGVGDPRGDGPIGDGAVVGGIIIALDSTMLSIRPPSNDTMSHALHRHRDPRRRRGTGRSDPPGCSGAEMKLCTCGSPLHDRTLLQVRVCNPLVIVVKQFVGNGTTADLNIGTLAFARGPDYSCAGTTRC